VCNSQESVNSLQESDFPTEESRRKFIKDSFKIDENEILNRDEKLKEEVVKLFLENFSTLALHPNHYGKTDLLELRIELQPGAVPGDYRTCKQSLGIATSSCEEKGWEDKMGD